MAGFVREEVCLKARAKRAERIARRRAEHEKAEDPVTALIANHARIPAMSDGPPLNEEGQ